MRVTREALDPNRLPGVAAGRLPATQILSERRTGKPWPKDPPEGASDADCIVIIGTLMIIYAALGGMRGTALIQMIKIVILLGTSAVLGLFGLFILAVSTS